MKEMRNDPASQTIKETVKRQESSYTSKKGFMGCIQRRYCKPV